MIKEFMKLALVGPPASGKGTISKWIQRDFGPLEIISTGSLLRKIASGSGPIADEMKCLLASGNLMEDTRITEILFTKLTELDGNWLIDGFPRTLRQAQLLDSSLKSSVTKIDIAIILDLPKEAVLSRINDRWVHVDSGRTYSLSFNPPITAGVDDVTGEPLTRRLDDQVDTFEIRWKNYQSHLKQLKEYYQNSGNLLMARGRDSQTLYEQIKDHILSGSKRDTPLITNRGEKLIQVDV